MYFSASIIKMIESFPFRCENDDDVKTTCLGFGGVGTYNTIHTIILIARQSIYRVGSG